MVEQNTGWNNPYTCASLTPTFEPWLNYNNAKTQDDAHASCVIPKSGTTDNLYCGNFLFSIEIPLGATIKGIELRIDKHCTIASVRDYLVQLCYGTYVLYGDNKADTVTTWTNPSDADIYIYYGGSSDMWNTGFTRTHIASSSFGVRIRASNGSPSVTPGALIDHVQIKITYELFSENVNETLNANIGYINETPVTSIRSVNEVG